jgi:glycosyltransferase involved in cell wall biosynthesis/tetratricopeptide (TPR) repeat protein
VIAPGAGDPLATVRIVAGLVRPGGVIVGTAPAARNRRHIEEAVAAVLSDGTRLETRPVGGSTRRELLDELPAAGLDVRWMRLVRDGWQDPVLLRPDGSGAVVESKDFLLRNVSAEVAEELTAEEIVFAAVRRGDTVVPECSIILVALAGSNPQRFADSLRDTAPEHDYELVVVQSHSGRAPIVSAISVLVADDAGLATRWNAGARAAAGELLVFVSADGEPLPGWLDQLVETHRSRPDTGAVGSKVIARDGTIEHAGLVLGPDRIPYRVYQGEPATAHHANRPRIMPAVAAEGMITARARFVEVGGFDETLGEDLTDADFCLRLRARGFPVMYSPAAALRSAPRSVPGTRGAFRRSTKEFATRWSRAAFRSDEVVCSADGFDANWHWDRSWRLPRPARPSIGGLPAIAWTSHFLESGGYTEEAIAVVEALDDAGLHVVANPVMVDRRPAPLPAHKADRLAVLMERDLPDDFVHVAHIGANRFKRHPAAMRNVGRTMFETDGLLADWRDQCNAMDEVWVPSEHNLRVFANAGVEASKLYKVPETFDTDLFSPDVVPLPVEGLEGLVFLSVFSWIDRKAWDVLLRAWFAEFGAQDDVTLLLKTDTDHARGTDCRHEVESFVRSHLKRDPKKGPRVVVLDRPLESTDVPRLYRAADAFVLASRGEGWGRPHMEAMAMGLPTIATRWSGNLEFMNDDNSYLVDYELVNTPRDSWFRGQRWAEPSVIDLRRAMRRVYEHRKEATATGARARADVLVSCRPELVAAAVRERIEAVDRHPVHVSLTNPELLDQSVAVGRRLRAKDGPRISACVAVQDGAASLSQCLSSLHGVADEIILVESESNEDMASVRNDALDRANGEWVLMLDATHTLDPASIDVVRDLVDKDEFVGYAARELHQFGLDGAVSTVEQRTAVLFPRHADLRYVGRVAEQLLPRRSGLKFRLVPSRVVLHQHDYRRERRDPVARARRQLPVLDRSVREEPHEPFHQYNLGIALERLAMHGEAETALRRAIELAPRGAMWGPSAYVSLSRVVGAQGRTTEAVALCRAATKRTPDWAYGWCVLGAALVDAGRTKAALRAYTRALNCAGDRSPAAGGPDDAAWQVRAGMGKIHLVRGENEEAAQCLRGAVALNPRNVELRLWLAQAYEAVGRPADARHHLEHATNVARAGPEAYVALSDFFTRTAEAALLRGLADDPESRVLLEQIERLRSARVIV